MNLNFMLAGTTSTNLILILWPYSLVAGPNAYRWELTTFT